MKISSKGRYAVRTMVELARGQDGLPAHKLHCSVLAEEAVKSAVEDYYNKKK